MVRSLRKWFYVEKTGDCMKSRRLLLPLLAVALLLAGGSASAAEQRFPPPEFSKDYQMPSMTRPEPRSAWLEGMDVVVLVGALSAAAYIALVKRSRKGMAGLSIFALAYFGFYRGGCVCPVGSVQNVALGLADPTYLLPFTVVLFFALPLLFSLLFGRVFCAGVCPLGAMQDLVLFKPIKLPDWLTTGLSVLPWLYLGGAVLFAVMDMGFIICRYDPFVRFFRLSGGIYMVMAAAGVMLLSVFVGRPYCRFLCPYGPLLGLLSRFSWKRVSITPESCVTCSLCDEACPFDAIERPTPEGVAEEA